MGLADVDLVAMLFGAGSTLSRIVYGLVGLSALFQLMPFFRAFRVGEVEAEGAFIRRQGEPARGDACAFEEDWQ